MKIYERKYTTEKALEQMKNLFVSLNERLEEDISNFVSEKNFFAIVEHDNGFLVGDIFRREWKTDKAKIGYRNGEFYFNCYDSGYVEHYREYFRVSVNEFWRIKKINFADMFSAFVEAVETYNEKSKEKDEQIERFLEIAKQF